jgi:translation initiation factor 5A
MDKKIGAIGELKEGSFILIEGTPCKVVDVTKSKPGKHGSAKIRLEAQGLVDDKRRSIVMRADERVEIPIIDKRNAQVVSITANKANCMDLETFEMFELEITPEYQGKVIEGATILYWDIGVKMIKGVK